jgi:hypothetical protein
MSISTQVSLFFILFAAACIPLIAAYDFTNIPPSLDHNAQRPLDSKDVSFSSSSSTTTADSVLYNVSSLGLPDPFSQYSTRITHDSKVEIGDPHNNQKGSILTLLNGTVYPLGSVGGIGAMGWEGGLNDTDLVKEGKGSDDLLKKSKNSSSGGGGISGAYTSQEQNVEVNSDHLTYEASFLTLLFLTYSHDYIRYLACIHL